MAKEELIEMQGKVDEMLPDTATALRWTMATGSLPTPAARCASIASPHTGGRQRDAGDVALRPVEGAHHLPPHRQPPALVRRCRRVPAPALIARLYPTFLFNLRAISQSAPYLKGSKMSNKLFVGNLSYSIQDSDLQQHFSAFGQVQSAKVIIERETGRSKGFGFVEMSSSQEADAAVRGMNGKSLAVVVT